MSNCNGRIFARRVGSDVGFLVVGRATAHQCPAFRQYAEDAVASGATRIQIDLRDCTHCDSTFLGTLLRLRKIVGEDRNGALGLVRPSADVRHILAQMGCQRLFDIIEQSPAPCGEITWQELPDDDGRIGSSCFKRDVVEAHQALAGAGGELAERFGPLAEAMQEELVSEEGRRRG